MRLLEWWGFPRKAWLVILVELSVIVGLSGWVVSEYVNNVYFQGYVNSLSPVLVPVVSVAVGAVSVTVTVVLYFGTRSMRGRGGPVDVPLLKRKVQAGRTVRKGQQTESRPVRTGGSSPGMFRARSSAVFRSGSGRRDVAESAGEKDSVKNEE